MHVSNFRPVKRAPDVIRIFKELLDRSIEAKLLMVGDGPDRAVAERLARDLGVYEDIRFLGKQDPIEEILSLADVFIMPSESETFGLAALEAMACGVPTIVNQVGGLPELVTHGKDGFLCGSGTIGEYVDYAYQILTKPELAASLSEAGRKRAKDFELSAIIPQYESFYARTIEQTMLPD
jgi:N-acetyl-alpha-D-glucosaminyl L-malate synthase BshA